MHIGQKSQKYEHSRWYSVLIEVSRNSSFDFIGDQDVILHLIEGKKKQEEKIEKNPFLRETEMEYQYITLLGGKGEGEEKAKIEEIFALGCLEFLEE